MSRLGRTFKAGRANIPRFYSPTSFFNRPFSGSDTLATDQTAARSLGNQMHYGDQGSWWAGTSAYTGPGYGNSQWQFSLGFNGPASFSHPLFCVRPSDPTQNISMQTVTGLDGFSPPAKWFGGEYSNLQSKLNAVPIPDKTKCPKITGTGNYVDIWAGGSDQSCCIWNLDTDEMWEFWVLNNSTSSPSSSAIAGTNWTCHYGGYIPKVSTFSGVLPNSWGSRAASLGEVGGMITYQDMANAWHGEPICHAIGIGAPMNGGVGSQVAPATRADGPGSLGNNVATIPTGFPGAGGANPAFHHDVTAEGQRFRFPAGTTASQVAGGLSHPMAIALCSAIENYGLIIVDTSGAVAFYIEDDRTFGSPYQQYGANATSPFLLNWGVWGDPRFDHNLPLLQGSFRTVMHELPWSQLQLLNPIVS